MFHYLRDNLFLAAQEGRLSESRSLRALSACWSTGSRVRNWLYDRRYLSTRRLPSFVISVGNLVAGGSGKTPLVHLIAEALQPLGPIAVLSRGYGASKKTLPLGDELTMLSKLLPFIRPYADKNRIISGQRAIQEGARIILLDDGFQYRKLERDLDLVVIDSSNPFGYGAFLPCGLLRDSPARLRQADAVFVNGAMSQTLASALRQWTQAPLIAVRPRLKRLLDLEGRQHDLQLKRIVGAFCAIGRPHRFLETLKEAGFEVVDHWFLADHSTPDPRKLYQFASKCRTLGATGLVCSQKDAVKLHLHSALLPIYYLEMQLEIISGKSEWENLIEKIHLKVNN